jgi:translation initiation factor IF-2
MGLDDVPQAGDIFRVVETEKQAREIVYEKHIAQGQAAAAPKTAMSLEQLFDRFQAGEVRELRLIVKADVQGSLEPIVSSLSDFNKGDIKVTMLAAASKAVVIGFNVQPDAGARRLAEAEGVSIRIYDIIYRLTEDVEKALKGMLEPEEKVTVIGHAEVRAVFRISKIGNIAGCRVTDGEIRRNARMRVLRAGETLHEGSISSLKHLQEDVREVRAGFECGIGLKGFDNIQVGDRLECFVIEKVAVA